MKRKLLVSQYLEDVAGAALDRYQSIIRSYVRRRHGVYALYRHNRLYYVGLASNLRARLAQHLKDKHQGKWDRFSVYLTIGDGHLKELESLVLRIVRPEGNAQIGRFTRSENLKSRLAREMRSHHRREDDDLLGRRRRDTGEEPAPRLKLKNGQRRPALAALVNAPLTIEGRFKGRLKRARIRRDGRIRCSRKTYGSPSDAASAACKRRMNGWSFWRYERAPGDWVKLRELRQ
jgi:hypothetical protein